MTSAPRPLLGIPLACVKPRARENATRVADIVGPHENDEGVALGVYVDGEPAVGERVRIIGARLHLAERHAYLVALERARQGFPRDARKRADVNARSAKVRLSAVGSTGHVRVRGLDRVDAVRRDGRVGLVADAATLGLHFAGSVGGGPRVGNEERTSADRKARDARERVASSQEGCVVSGGLPHGASSERPSLPRERASGVTPRRSARHVTFVGSALFALFACVALGCASQTTRVMTAQEQEQTACSAVSAQDRDRNPFANPELLEGVTESMAMERGGKLALHRLAGAEIMMRATPGATGPWLTRVLRCHAARHVTTVLSDRDVDPLAVGRPHIIVSERQVGFAITIRSDDDHDAREILRRAQRLVVTDVTPQP